MWAMLSTKPDVLMKKYMFLDFTGLHIFRISSLGGRAWESLFLIGIPGDCDTDQLENL